MKKQNYIEYSKKSVEAVFNMRSVVLDKLSLKKAREICFGCQDHAEKFLDMLLEKANANNGRVSLFYMQSELPRLIGFDERSIGIPYICSWIGWEKDDLENEARIKRGPGYYGCVVKLPKLRIYSEALDEGLKIDHSDYGMPL